MDGWNQINFIRKYALGKGRLNKRLNIAGVNCHSNVPFFIAPEAANIFPSCIFQMLLYSIAPLELQAARQAAKLPGFLPGSDDAYRLIRDTWIIAANKSYHPARF